MLKSPICMKNFWHSLRQRYAVGADAGILVHDEDVVEELRDDRREFRHRRGEGLPVAFLDGVVGLAGELFERFVEAALRVGHELRRIYLAGLAFGLREEVLDADCRGDEFQRTTARRRPS